MGLEGISEVWNFFESGEIVSQIVDNVLLVGFQFHFRA
ncbi:hypothetical protein PS718_04223 [Pseudomonas fluorescens]|uniref:Uncharacterized protein n=1 Tax=Pseudomonas fluorescens TaxID=294 RepID=A0A5E7DX94_PSEFL|nr:hypothetical protein PS718_04223 [Pseudomonas fluorescens]